MSHKIFINTENEFYKDVTLNASGVQYGLGVPMQLTPEERADFASNPALAQKSYEIYFTADELREKRRKLQLIVDSFTDAKFFGDGAVKPEAVKKYIEQEIGKVQQLGANNFSKFGDLVKIGGAGYLAGLIGLGSAFGISFGIGATAVSSAFGGALIGAFAAVPGFALILGAASIFQGIGAARQSGREDRKASWRFTRPDFPNVIGQAIMNASNLRSIERLYDDRGGIKTFDVSTAEAIVLLVGQTMADALFCTKPNGATQAVTPPEHPAPGGIGSGDRWNEANKQRLRRHFNANRLKRETGPDANERTYVGAVGYVGSYIALIDAILNLQDESLSRSPDVEEANISLKLDISLETANVQLFRALSSAASEVVREKVLTFFDQNREYKTILNFGEDKQYLAEAWRLAPKNSGSIQFKLLTPLESGITVQTRAYVVRELAKPVIDTIQFELSPLIDNTPYLRPFNMDERNSVNARMFSNITSLTSLGLATASAGAVVSGSTAISYEDSVFRRWFTGDFKSSELNIDFTDYKNFVSYGSAYKRLQAFSNKLEKIEALTSASISSSVSSSTISLMLKAKEKEDIIRNFDPYEQFLYYATGSIPYTASVFYTSNEMEYNTTAYWPKKSDGVVYSPTDTTISSWLTTQTGIAQRYDYNNPNYIILNLPKHIQEDEQSADFLNLFEMVGHLIDNIKVYIDQFPNIYSTNPDPLKELSMDQVYEVAQSFGLNLPNVYALENLQSFNAQFTGESGSRSYVAETWKRFLHSMVYLGKTKGSRTSFDALLNTYGISSPVLQIKETTYPAAQNYIKSDELTYGLQFTGSAENYIQIPFVSSSITASSIQLRFNPTLRQTSSIITGNGWAIDLIPHPSSSKLEYGKINVVSGSGRVVIASSSYFPLFSDDYTNFMLRSQSADISIVQTDGDQILFQQSASANIASLWNNTTFIYVGGSGSMQLGSNFSGIIDEIRVWGENISDEDFIAQSYDPGSYYGATYTSSYTDLYVHVPFSQPLSSITQSATNESPYQEVSKISSLPAVGFTTASYYRLLRTVKQFTPIVGSTIYTNKKITVAPPPSFNIQFVDDNGTKTLSRVTSIKRLEDKQYNSGQNVVSFAISPTDFINQNIIRSMGVIDVNNVIGSPRYITGSGYSSLQSIQKDYAEYFNKTINPNEYIRFFKDLVQGPGEVAEGMTPARAKLLDGILIESPVLSRNKDTIYRTFKVDGSATKALVAYTSGSGSGWDSTTTIGAYDFATMAQTASLLPSTPADTLPLTTTIAISSSINFKSSTKYNKIPFSRKMVQQVAVSSFATASINDENSGFATLDALPIISGVSSSTVSPGYARGIYYGIPSSGSLAKRFDSEENTVTPFYDVPPRANLADVGSTSYFHKPNGKYYYDIYTLYKQLYVAKLDTKLDSPIDRLYAPVTLLPENTIIAEYGRNLTTISSDNYASGSSTVGTIKVANIFTLYGINGATGLRIRMYRTSAEQAADVDRDFYTAPALNSGVMFDALLTGEDDVFPYLTIQSNDALIYYTINNITSETITSPIQMYYFAFEPDDLIPRGYLPRHYKFSRDNTIGLKRRNYLGCRNVSTTFDTDSPIVITLSGTNNIVVNSSTIPTTNTTGGGSPIRIPSEAGGLEFGGGGPLNVE